MTSTGLAWSLNILALFYKISGLLLQQTNASSCFEYLLLHVFVLRHLSLSQIAKHCALRSFLISFFLLFFVEFINPIAFLVSILRINLQSLVSFKVSWMVAYLRFQLPHTLLPAFLICFPFSLHVLLRYQYVRTYSLPFVFKAKFYSAVIPLQKKAILYHTALLHLQFFFSPVDHTLPRQDRWF